MTRTDSFSECVPSFEQTGLPPDRLAMGMAVSESAPDAPERIGVLFASPEVFPLAKTGGLADVSAALPAALSELGVDIRIVMPGYTESLDLAESKRKAIPLGDIQGLGEAALIVARTPDSGLPLLLVDCPALFRRHGRLYSDPEGKEWPDNAIRFALFSHAVTRIALGKAGINWRPHIAHVNDWHLGLAPALLRAQLGPRPRTVFTIHNLAFQGVFSADVFPLLGLPGGWLSPDGIEFYGQISFLKAGIRFADRLTTVSPTYAREVLTPEFGCGLDGLLRTRANDLVGILNGVDYESWTPENPAHVPYPFHAGDLSGKQQCKVMLQNELGLRADPHAPVIAFVSRITEQKMADVLPEITPTLTDNGAQFVVCGDGDRSIEQALRALQARQPRQIAVRIGYQEAMARRILAGADILAAPARFEPCGLTQMYAMRYGTIPVVRRVGGLADTVIGHGASEDSMKDTGTGFMFDAPTGGNLASAIERAINLYRRPEEWRGMQKRAMRQDFRWMRSAQRYRTLYEEFLQEPGIENPDSAARSRSLELRTGT